MHQPGHEVVVALAVLHLEFARRVVLRGADLERKIVLAQRLRKNREHGLVLEDPEVVGTRGQREPGFDDGLVERAPILEPQKTHARHQPRDMPLRAPRAGPAVEPDMHRQDFANQLLDGDVGRLLSPSSPSMRTGSSAGSPPSDGMAEDEIRSVRPDSTVPVAMTFSLKFQFDVGRRPCST